MSPVMQVGLKLKPHNAEFSLLVVTGLCAFWKLLTPLDDF